MISVTFQHRVFGNNGEKLHQLRPSDGIGDTLAASQKQRYQPPFITYAKHHLILSYFRLKITQKTTVMCVITYVLTYTFPPYLQELSHSNPSPFWDGFPKLTANFCLVPPLLAALAVRRINRLLAGPTGGHLRDNPLTLLPGRAGCIRRLPQALRIMDNFMVVSLSVLIEFFFLSLLVLRWSARDSTSGRNKKES